MAVAAWLGLRTPIDMQTEIEAKFLDQDFTLIRQYLEANNARLIEPMRKMRRVILDFEDHRLQSNNSYVRVRDEGEKITVTYKQFDSLSVDGAKEISLTVDDFEAACNIFEAIGLKISAYQESKRETWELGAVEIVLDEWPWLKPYIEIEGPDEKSIRNVAEVLALDWENAVFGDVTVAYAAEYNVDVAKVGKSDFYFDKPAPNWLESVRKA